jgi:hypothetical protein
VTLVYLDGLEMSDEIAAVWPFGLTPAGVNDSRQDLYLARRVGRRVYDPATISQLLFSVIVLTGKEHVGYTGSAIVGLKRKFEAARG